MSMSIRCLLPEADFTLDDCDALLKFPYQDYVHPVRQETEDSDLPELGSSANLVLNETATDVLDTIPDGEGSSIDPKVLEACLRLNQKLQQKIIQKLNKLFVALSKNNKKQEEILQKIQFEERGKSLGDCKIRVQKSFSLFAAPYFRDVKGMIPPDNEDTIVKAKNNDITAYHHPPRPWTLAEKDRLIQGVGANALSYVLKPYKIKRDFLKAKLKSKKDKNISDAEIENLKKQVIAIEGKMRLENERPYKDLVTEAQGSINWMTISATNMEGARSEEECELLWNNYLSPFVCKECFTEEEDAKLKLLVKKYKGRNWDAIAIELNTNRSAIQCFERYQRKLNKALCKKYWTPEEDKKLSSLVEIYRIGKYIPWNKICCKMEGRFRYQIINRYERTVCEDIKRGPWSHAEDAMVLACVAKFGNKWAKMQEFFSGRPIYTIRERYVNTLNPDLRAGNWSKAEDMELINLIKTHGYGKWSLISRFLPGRTDNMCSSRTKKLIIHSLAKAHEDIDWDFENVQKLVDILKPVAVSNASLRQNSKLRNTQTKAKETLKFALEIIAPLLDEAIDLEAIDLSQVSLNTLRILCQELSNSDTQREVVESKPLPFTPGPHRALCKPTIIRRKRARREYGDEQACKESSLTPDESEGEEDKVRLSKVEKIWLRKVLDYKMKEEASILFTTNSARKKAVCLNSEETLESSLYQAYLQKELLGQIYLDEDMDDFVVGDVDYNVTLAQATHFFLQPRISEKDLMVLTPNCSTLLGMDMILTSEKRLRRTANFVDHSRPYIRYITGYSDVLPKCLACSIRDNDPLEFTFEQVVQNMKSNMLMVDEVMEREAKLEVRSYTVDQVQQLQCQCKALEESKAEVELLAKRLLSMFWWPFLLSTIGVREAQIQLVSEPTPAKYGCGPNRKKHRFYQTKRRVHSPAKKASNNQDQGESFSDVPVKRTYTRKSIKKVRKPSTTSDLPTATPARRSSRSCVLNRKSFGEADSDEDELT